jgi:hypothetical protein
LQPFEGTGDERVQRGDDGVPIPPLVGWQEPAVDQFVDFTVPYLQRVAAKPVAMAVPGLPHPLSGTGTVDLGLSSGLRLGHRSPRFYTATPDSSTPDDSELAGGKLGVIILEAREEVSVHIKGHFD